MPCRQANTGGASKSSVAGIIINGRQCGAKWFPSAASKYYCIILIAPRLFFELAKTTQHDFGSATQRGADYAEALETCRCTYKAEYASGPVPKPVRYRYRWHLASEPEFSGNANGICSKVVPKRSQMSVLMLLYRFIPY